MSVTGPPNRGTLTWPQSLAVVVGLAYTVFGLVGLAVTGVSDFSGRDGHALLGITVNPAHNVLHFVTGLLGLALAGLLGTARAYGWFLALGYGALFAYGVWGAERRDVLALDDGANVVHLVTALIGVLMAVVPARIKRRTGARRR